MRLTNSQVILAAEDYNLTTLVAVKREYDIQTSDQDVYLSSQIAHASDAIASYCGRIFALQTYLDSFRLHWRRGRGHFLFLAQRPVIPGSLTITRDSSLLVEDIDYYVSYAGGEVRLPHSSGGIKIDVTYSAGWILPGWESSGGSGTVAMHLPLTIESAALQMILSSRQSGRLAWTDRNPLIRSETIEGVGTLQYSQTAIGSSASNSVSGISPQVASLLAPFCEPTLA